MSAASRYKRFLKLCEAWPADPTKQGRDISPVIRQRVLNAFYAGDGTHLDDPKKCDSDYEIMHRLVTNYHRARYESDIVRNIAALGITYDECHTFMSSEVIDELIEDNKGKLWSNVKRLFKRQ